MVAVRVVFPGTEHVNVVSADAGFAKVPPLLDVQKNVAGRVNVSPMVGEKALTATLTPTPT
jgi:hypothetical protein